MTCVPDYSLGRKESIKVYQNKQPIKIKQLKGREHSHMYYLEKPKTQEMVKEALRTGLPQTTHQYVNMMEFTVTVVDATGTKLVVPPFTQTDKAPYQRNKALDELPAGKLYLIRVVKQHQQALPFSLNYWSQVKSQLDQKLESFRQKHNLTPEATDLTSLYNDVGKAINVQGYEIWVAGLYHDQKDYQNLLNQGKTESTGGFQSGPQYLYQNRNEQDQYTEVYEGYVLCGEDDFKLSKQVQYGESAIHEVYHLQTETLISLYDPAHTSLHPKQATYFDPNWIQNVDQHRHMSMLDSFLWIEAIGDPTYYPALHVNLLGQAETIQIKPNKHGDRRDGVYIHRLKKNEYNVSHQLIVDTEYYRFEDAVKILPLYHSYQEAVSAKQEISHQAKKDLYLQLQQVQKELEQTKIKLQEVEKDNLRLKAELQEKTHLISAYQHNQSSHSASAVEIEKIKQACQKEFEDRLKLVRMDHDTQYKLLKDRQTEYVSQLKERIQEIEEKYKQSQEDYQRTLKHRDDRLQQQHEQIMGLQGQVQTTQTEIKQKEILIQNQQQMYQFLDKDRLRLIEEMERISEDLRQSRKENEEIRQSQYQAELKKQDRMHEEKIREQKEKAQETTTKHKTTQGVLHLISDLVKFIPTTGISLLNLLRVGLA